MGHFELCSIKSSLVIGKGNDPGGGKKAADVTHPFLDDLLCRSCDVAVEHDEGAGGGVTVAGHSAEEGVEGSHQSQTTEEDDYLLWRAPFVKITKHLSEVKVLEESPHARFETASSPFFPLKTESVGRSPDD